MAVRPIFLFSLPRSGSTMLQRMLACHTEISTHSELWFLLPHVEALTNRLTEALYSTTTLGRATSSLVEQMSGGVDSYYKAIRALSDEIYGSLVNENHIYILDKTPRYYFIIKQIEKIFPDAKFIFLFRNPLSVMASINESFNEGRLGDYRNKIDLYEGPGILAQAYKEFSLPSHTLHYENLVKNPGAEMQAVCDYLEIDYMPEAISNFTKIPLGAMGDKVGSRKYTAVDTASVEKWKKVFATPYRKKVLSKYVQHIGETTLNTLGYPISGLENEIDNLQVKFELGVKDRLNEIKSRVYTMLEVPLLQKKFNSRKKYHGQFYIHY